MAEYTNITLEEMQDFLRQQGFKLLPAKKLANTLEKVFAKRIDQKGFQLTLRIYTGITSSGNSRDVGKDAIRVNLFYRTNDGKKIAKLLGAKRVHRVKNWRMNLQKRIDAILNMSIDICPKCKSPLVVRKSKNGDFTGCTNYPECSYTQTIK